MPSLLLPSEIIVMTELSFTDLAHISFDFLMDGFYMSSQVCVLSEQHE
jgi:hypothetical protein